MDSSDSSPSESSVDRNRHRGREEQQAIRSSLHFAVGRICLAEEEESGGARMSSEAIGALTELAYQYATTSLANDLVCFSQHANRRTVTVDDVKLVARKDPDGLLQNLTKFCEENNLGTSTATGRNKGGNPRRKKNGAAPRPAIKPNAKKSKAAGPKAKQASTGKKHRGEHIMKLINASSSSSDESESDDDSDDDATDERNIKPVEKGKSMCRSIIDNLSDVRTPPKDRDDNKVSYRQNDASAADNSGTDDMIIDLSGDSS